MPAMMGKTVVWADTVTADEFWEQVDHTQPVEIPEDSPENI